MHRSSRPGSPQVCQQPAIVEGLSNLRFSLLPSRERFECCPDNFEFFGRTKYENHPIRLDALLLAARQEFLAAGHPSRPVDAVTPDEGTRLGALQTELGKRTADLGIPLAYHNHLNTLSQSPTNLD